MDKPWPLLPVRSIGPNWDKLKGGPVRSRVGRWGGWRIDAGLPIGRRERVKSANSTGKEYDDGGVTELG